MTKKRISKKMWYKSEKELDLVAEALELSHSINNMLSILKILNPDLAEIYINKFKMLSAKHMNYRDSDQASYTSINNVSNAILDFQKFYIGLEEILERAEEEENKRSLKYYKEHVDDTIQTRNKKLKRIKLKRKICKCNK